MSRRNEKHSRKRPRSRSRSKEDHYIKKEKKEYIKSEIQRVHHHRHREHKSQRHKDRERRFPVKIKVEPKTESDSDDSPKVNKQKPNFELSGKLAADTNTYNGVVIKYNEPPEARKPKKRWRLYAFKGDKTLPMLPIHRQSAYLLGRERKVADIPIDHPSCSKQHAVLQYRLVPYDRDDGTKGRRVSPYIIDLGSANGTFINNNKIEAQRYFELKEMDLIKFGFSSREYVILHEQSQGVVEEEKDEGFDLEETDPSIKN